MRKPRARSGSATTNASSTKLGAEFAPGSPHTFTLYELALKEGGRCAVGLAALNRLRIRTNVAEGGKASEES